MVKTGEWGSWFSPPPRNPARWNLEGSTPTGVPRDPAPKGAARDSFRVRSAGAGAARKRPMRVPDGEKEMAHKI